MKTTLYAALFTVGLLVPMSACASVEDDVLKQCGPRPEADTLIRDRIKDQYGVGGQIKAPGFVGGKLEADGKRTTEESSRDFSVALSYCTSATNIEYYDRCAATIRDGVTYPEELSRQREKKYEALRWCSEQFRPEGTVGSFGPESQKKFEIEHSPESGSAKWWALGIGVASLIAIVARESGGSSDPRPTVSEVVVAD